MSESTEGTLADIDGIRVNEDGELEMEMEVLHKGGSPDESDR